MAGKKKSTPIPLQMPYSEQQVRNRQASNRLLWIICIPSLIIRLRFWMMTR